MLYATIEASVDHTLNKIKTIQTYNNKQTACVKWRKMNKLQSTVMDYHEASIKHPKKKGRRGGGMGGWKGKRNARNVKEDGRKRPTHTEWEGRREDE